MLTPFGYSYILRHGGERSTPLANREQGAETIEMPCGKKG
jgi:hypothetical protein